MSRPKTKTTAQSKNEYAAKNYDRLSIIVPKGTKDMLKAKCAKDDTNPNRLINEWIAAYLGDSVIK